MTRAALDPRRSNLRRNDWKPGYPTDGNICCNGLIAADRSLQPEIQHGTVPAPDAAPGSDATVRIPYRKPELLPGAEYWLNLSFVLTEDTSWASAGHSIAAAQLALPWSAPAEPEGTPPNVSFKETDTEITVNGRDFALVLNKKKGTFTDYHHGRKQLLADGPVPNFWRGPTDNDIGRGAQKDSRTWRNAGKNRAVTPVGIERVDPGELRITVDATLPTRPAPSEWNTVFTIRGDGEVRVHHTLRPGKGLPELLMVGILLTVPAGFENFSWYGRGPQENYWYRRTGAFIGAYRSTVDEQFTPYVRPQQTGNVTEVRHAALTDQSGSGLAVSAEPDEDLLELSALHYTPFDLDGPKHPYELRRRNQVTLGINHRRMGVGGNDSWGAPPLDQYRLPADRTYEYAYRLAPARPQR